MSKVTIVSGMSPQKGQKHRSSENFTTKGMADSVLIRAYYDYGSGHEKEATDIVFDIKVDKSGLDPTWQEGIRSGRVSGNTGDRNLYIANPIRDAGSAFRQDTFTVEVIANSSRVIA